MPVSEAQKKATAKYEKENYDKILVRFPKGTKELIQKSGAASINGYIIKCVLDSLAATEKESSVSAKTQEAVKLMEILPESYREIALETQEDKRMNRETIKSMIDFIPEEDIDTVYKVLIKFIPTDKPSQDEIEMIKDANEDKSPTISHNEINWN